MKIHSLLGLIAAALVLPAQAQQSSSSPASDAPGTAAAREALKQKEGDADQTTLLKQTLTAVDKQYSLIRRGQVQTTYDFNYTYIGQEKINANFADGSLTLFNIENDSSHIITNTLSVDYGVRDNLTASLSLPLVSKYSETPASSGLSHSLGDMGIGARFQPWEAHRGRPSMTFTGNVRLPTGRSPFKVDPNQGLATGSGVTTLTAGVNVNHIVDPVALFGSLNASYSTAAKHLSQRRDGNLVLNRVDPGASISFGLGFAYALSYGISTSVSVQETISRGTKLHFDNGSEFRTKTQTAGVLSLGLGYRISPKTTLNFTAGIGLTADSPNFSLGMSMPLSF
ncbi:MAG TPA: transporter [Noviherbaspirillum sp.]|uniref:transporter n=1 Tax=Noviherbaspirillum sp. TaxID=1926288 RepID=UPI002B474CBA|nr:transporter [Noviherbaspirillum sp.]HJV86199.1 transporter [Noviherbaspirillum sp.]